GVLRLGPGDLVGPHERVVDPADDGGHRVGRVQALVGVGLAGQVGVGGDLPAGQVDGPEAGPDLLHGLVAGQGAKSVDVPAGVQQRPQPLGPEPGQRVLLLDRAAQADHVGGAVGPLDPGPARVGGPLPADRGDLLVHALAGVSAGVSAGACACACAGAL